MKGRPHLSDGTPQKFQEDWDRQSAGGNDVENHLRVGTPQMVLEDRDRQSAGWQ